MFEDLLPYYNRELTFFRNSAAAFARNYPKVAARLQLSPELSEDPHVERLIEAVALLNARTRQKLEDDFPELTQAYLSALFPNYLRPIPSSAIIQLKLDKSQSDRTDGAAVKRGTVIETAPISGEKCQFRTCYETRLWPFEISDAGFYGRPFTAPVTPFSRTANAVIRIDLKCFGEKLAMNDLSLSKLRLFLQGESNYVSPLYEYLLANALGLAVGVSNDDQPLNVSGPESINPVGFHSDEALFPWPASASESYRLLSEFFVFPQKFHFVDLHLNNFRSLPERLSQLSLFIYLDKHLADLEQTVDSGTFRTGCTPVVNLYRKRMEPFGLTNHEFEHRVTPSNTNPLNHEIYSIDRVTLTKEEEEIRVHEFFSLNHVHETDRQYFWKGTRRPATHDSEVPDKGTEIFLNLIDLRENEAAAAGYSVDIEATCVNRDLPGRLPFGGGQPELSALDLPIPLESIRCLTPPTPTLRPPTDRETLWRLISHLSVGQLSMSQGEAGAEALRETLTLYNIKDSSE
ncbi:MAG: type VI secretion system baseplate subunit TssF, partial [Planctomycetes bacterium]|nr:type VI secretion system baseplate subunit TssF [Planctomycetota bacterium]